MADFVSRIGGVGPTYPVRPVKRPRTDEDSNEAEHEPKQQNNEADDNSAAELEDDSSPGKHIDERV
ncbi:MAG: hypothetical protein AAFX56_01910 [Pseudomonadota bacterium]